MRVPLICIVACALVGCLSLSTTDHRDDTDCKYLFDWSRLSYGEADGASPEQAVILAGISVQFLARKAKENWIDAHSPGARVVESRRQIIRGRILDVLTLEDKQQAVRRVYFDVTSTVGKPGLGLWYFVDTNGEYRGGEIDEEYFRRTALAPWTDVVEKKTGILIYQIDDEEGNGLFAFGAMSNGERTGEWRFERCVDGLSFKQFP